MRCKLYAEVFFIWVSDGIWFGSWWLFAGWILSSVLWDYYLEYIPMYNTCLPTYLHAYLPIMYNSLLYWSLNYLRRSSNSLTYLLSYLHTYVTTYIPMYLCTFVPTYLYYLHIFFGIIYVPMYSTCLPTYLRAYVPIVRFIALYLLKNYLRRSSNLLMYLGTNLQTYLHNYLRIYVPMYLCTYVPI